MRPELQVFLSGCLTFGIPLVLAFRELRLLRRGGSWRPDPAPDPQPKPLPPCLLVPNLTPERTSLGPPDHAARARALEPA